MRAAREHESGGVLVHHEQMPGYRRHRPKRFGRPVGRPLGSVGAGIVSLRGYVGLAIDRDPVSLMRALIIQHLAESLRPESPKALWAVRRESPS